MVLIICGSGPAAARARQLKGSRSGSRRFFDGWRKLVPQGDLMKVAQYEVLGNETKKQVRPVSVRDDRTARFLILNAAQRLLAFVNRPVRDGKLFKNANPALRTGLLSLSPSGTKVLAS